MEDETPYDASGVKVLECIQSLRDVEQVTPPFPL